MRAMILAAGFGTRLGALSDECPKPLLPVCDRPAIHYSLSLLHGAGFTEVMINLHHHGDLIEGALGSSFGAIAIHDSREPVILGTGGGIRHAADWLTRGGRERFCVLNGKLVVSLNLRALLEADAHAASRGALATMVLRHAPDPDRWGAVETAGDQVVRIIGKGRAPDVASQQKWMFTGIHVLGPELVSRLPAGESCIIRQGYLPALAEGGVVAWHEQSLYFEEHSTPRRYLDGNLALLADPTRLLGVALPAELVGVHPSAEIDPGATLTPPLRIGPGARVAAGARVGPSVVLGARAIVEQGATIERAVVWSEARVSGVVRDAIVTPRGVFPVG